MKVSGGAQAAQAENHADIMRAKQAKNEARLAGGAAEEEKK